MMECGSESAAKSGATKRSFFTKHLVKTTREGPVDILQNPSLKSIEPSFVENINIRPNEIDECWSHILNTFRQSPTRINVVLDPKLMVQKKPILTECIMKALHVNDEVGWVDFQETNDVVNLACSFSIRGMFRMRNEHIAFILSNDLNAYIVDPSIIVRLQVWGTTEHLMNIHIQQPVYRQTMAKWFCSVSSILQKRMRLMSIESEQAENNMDLSENALNTEVLGLPII